MGEIPKLTKNPDLLAPTKPRTVGTLGKALLLGGTVLAGLGIGHATPGSAKSVTDVTSMTAPTSGARAGNPEPLVLKPATLTPLLAQHQSHVSHSSHRSHSSHHSHHSSSF